MDYIEMDGSDSYLSDSWNIIDTSDEYIHSESDSIEILNEEDDDQNQNDTQVTNINILEVVEAVNNDNLKTITEEGSTLLKSSANDKTERCLIEDIPNSEMQLHLLPKDGHAISSSRNQSSPNIIETMCSISLIILCTTTFSFMVIDSDNITPNLLNILAWQRLPDYQKNMDTVKKGLFSEQMGVHNEKNKILEKQLNFVELVVMAYEENLVSDTGFIDLIRNMKISSSVESIEIRKVKTKVRKDKLTDAVKLNKPTSLHKLITKDIDQYNFEFSSRSDRSSILNNVFILMNCTNSNTSLIISNASVVMEKNKKVLNYLKNIKHLSNGNNHDANQIEKFSFQIESIEKRFINNVFKYIIKNSIKFHDNMLKFDESLNKYICKLKKKSVIFNENVLNESLCSKAGDNNNFLGKGNEEANLITNDEDLKIKLIEIEERIANFFCKNIDLRRKNIEKELWDFYIKDEIIKKRDSSDFDKHQSNAIKFNPYLIDSNRMGFQNLKDPKTDRLRSSNIMKDKFGSIKYLNQPKIKEFKKEKKDQFKNPKSLKASFYQHDEFYRKREKSQKDDFDYKNLIVNIISTLKKIPKKYYFNIIREFTKHKLFSDEHSNFESPEIEEIIRMIFDGFFKYLEVLKMEHVTLNAYSGLDNSTFINGDWYLTRGLNREELRVQEKKSDWLFERAKARKYMRNDRDFLNSVYKETEWFFRRYWKKNPKSKKNRFF